jgi:hypothetical protein
MNKKLYFLDEDEKNRILNLHESRTKKQYLINETISKTQAEIDAESNPALKKALDAKNAKKNHETKLYNNRKKRAAELENKCVAKRLQPKPNDVSSEFVNWYIGQKWDELPKILSKLNSLDQFCQFNTNVKNQTENSNFANYIKDKKGISNWLYSEIYSQASWMKYFEVPLVKVLKSAGMETYDSYAEGKLELTTSGWQNYPCVTKSTNVVATRLKDGSLGYRGGGFLWYSNGRKQNLQTGEMSNYHCGEDGKVKEGLKSEVSKESSKQFANVEPVSGIGVVIPSAQTEIPTLMKMAGMEGQPINQDTINKLYDILSKK